MGPNYSISTACATANYCFVAAANHIRNGDADIVVAGGSEAAVVPVGLGGFVACRCVCVCLVLGCCVFCVGVQGHVEEFCIGVLLG